MSNREKAIIIGGGISGKLAARVLSDFFKEVIILERDDETNGQLARKGARQGDHLHALLHAGQYGLEALFPGITETFHNNGAVKINSTKDLAWFHHGVWKLRYDGGKSTTLQSRPHLEWHIEQYIKNISNVTYLYSQNVKNLLHQQEGNRIYGVEVSTNDGNSKTLTADLIVDASGSSSLTAHFFKKLNIPIQIEKVAIGLCYVSKTFRLPKSQTRDWKIKLIYPNPPDEKIGGTISKIENDQHIVTIIGYQNSIQEKEVLKDESGFLHLANRLPKADIYNELIHAEPLSKTTVYRVPHISWKRIDKTKQLPKGLLLIGDTVCRIDPVFGQGMSIAIIEALTMQKLFKNNNDDLDKLQTTFHKKIAKILSPIWNMVITEDFRYPGVSGKKPFGLSIQQWYSKHIFLLSSKNQKVYESFIDVMNLVQSPTILLRPWIVKKVLVHRFFMKRKDN
ncbi:NAD(P)/FAD-dependent oxidoreductase [Sporosarcina sp. BP05]|uniref:NAD(P)/FAD-dependent oxidoreductase n=1 Tax=Sporosarcina sp. BP05 TaxID=2758726 RepID=UPI0016468079|nr:FAD-dependent oxidoreductase [Sporosarcina sp. BP05]